MFTETNGALHATMHEHFWTLLERLTALELDAARAEFETLMGLITRHMLVEEGEILPAFAALAKEAGDAQQAAKDERLVLGDHVILTRTEETVRARLAALPEGDRRAMVLALDDVLRFGRVLEHHTDREQKLLYPQLDARMPAAQRDALCEKLRTQTLNLP